MMPNIVYLPLLEQKLIEYIILLTAVEALIPYRIKFLFCYSFDFVSLQVFSSEVNVFSMALHPAALFYSILLDPFDTSSVSFFVK